MSPTFLIQVTSRALRHLLFRPTLGFMKQAILAAAATLIFAASHLEGSRSIDAAAAIRIYNYANVPTGQLAAARATADRIFADAGISLQWTDCRTSAAGRGAADRLAGCTELLREGHEFVLRLFESGTDEANPYVALGTSMIDREARGGVLMTVNPRPVLAVAQRASMDPSILLGRAIAHELGHLLLGRVDHPRSGLMRAFWSQNELRGGRPADWRFSTEEAQLMRQGLRDRTWAAN